MLNEDKERREIKAIATTMLSDLLAILAEDFTEASIPSGSARRRFPSADHERLPATGCFSGGWAEDSPHRHEGPVIIVLPRG
ncbi:hypothetical protein ACVIIV_003036 [Bradyrhizobium sp. USDA 4354]